MAPIWLRQSVELALAEDLGEVELRREPATHSVVRPLAELQVAEGGRPVPLEDKTEDINIEGYLGDPISNVTSSHFNGKKALQRLPFYIQTQCYQNEQFIVTRKGPFPSPNTMYAGGVSSVA